MRLELSNVWWESWHTFVCLAQLTEHSAKVSGEGAGGTGLEPQVRQFICLGRGGPPQLVGLLFHIPPGELAGLLRHIRKQALTS